MIRVTLQLRQLSVENQLVSLLLTFFYTGWVQDTVLSTHEDSFALLHKNTAFFKRQTKIWITSSFLSKILDNFKPSFLLPRKRPKDAGFDQRDFETKPKHSNRKKSFAKTAEQTRMSRSRCFRSMIRFFFRSLLVFRARMKTPKILNAQRWNEHGLRLDGPGQKFGSHSIRKRLCGQTQG